MMAATLAKTRTIVENKEMLLTSPLKKGKNWNPPPKKFAGKKFFPIFHGKKKAISRKRTKFLGKM